MQTESVSEYMLSSRFCSGYWCASAQLRGWPCCTVELYIRRFLHSTDTCESWLGGCTEHTTDCTDMHVFMDMHATRYITNEHICLTFCKAAQLFDDIILTVTLKIKTTLAPGLVRA